ncbi:T9SS type B sorting domain-containing protein [Flavobacterium enshiense]|uniref:T9SS type B sorting domain-containing protein n=1 Tax=Flavobacterium enshiense TaxID=1341165 RepID=UPI00345C99AC
MISFKPKNLIFLFLLCFQLSFSQNDCSDAIIVCGNSDFTQLSATGSGVQELNNSNNCGSQENNSLWLKVSIESSGTLGFTLTPESNDIDIDFDFFIFGPNASCGNLGRAIRCSTTNPQAAGQSNNLTGLNSSETDTSEGPAEDGNSFVKWLNVQAGQTYFIVIDRPVGTSNFSLNWTGTATFSAPPVFNVPTTGTALNLSKCDADGNQDNLTQFDLTQNNNLILGSQTNTSISFHNSVNDAITNTNAIVNPNTFTNSSNPQTIHIRLTNTVTGCFANTSFTIEVTPLQTNNPSNLEECDLDNDGFANFNLRDNDATIFGNDPNLSVTYHPFQNSPLTLPNNYTNQTAFTNETVWAKITNTVSGCFIYKSFELVLLSRPVVTPAQLTQCDFQLSPDGLTAFNLTEANTTITGSNSNYTTTFYTNTANAQSDTGALNTTYTNTQNPQTLGVRVTDNTTGCYTITTLTLNVTVNPTVTKQLHECDDDGTEDGYTEFDLTDAGFENSGNTVTYFSNSNNALLEIDPIATIFTNTEEDTQRIYARIENGNDCIGINIIDLFVEALPDIDISDEAVFCLNKSNIPVTLDAGIGNQNPSNFTYSWTPNGETTPTIAILSAGTYTVTVTNNDSYNCFKVRTIVVKESDLALVESVAIVDLSDNNSVTVFVQGDESDYTYSLDLPNGPFQESNYFDDVTPGIHHVYISDKDGCGIQKHEISLLGIPNFFTPNGDGINDTWKIEGMGKGHYKNSVIYIFDRYGKLLKQMAPSSDGWNGTFNGQPVASSDYWYVMHLEDGRTIKGHISLKR